ELHTNSSSRLSIWHLFKGAGRNLSVGAADLYHRSVMRLVSFSDSADWRANMRRQDVSGFDDEDSGQVIDYMDAGLGPHLRTHFPQIVPPALRLTIGSREFTLDADRDPGVSRIMLVERDFLVRAALAALISTWKGVHVVAEVRTLKEALAQRHMSPDVVVVS